MQFQRMRTPPLSLINLLTRAISGLNALNDSVACDWSMAFCLVARENLKHLRQRRRVGKSGLRLGHYDQKGKRQKDRQTEAQTCKEIEMKLTRLLHI